MASEEYAHERWVGQRWKDRQLRVCVRRHQQLTEDHQSVQEDESGHFTVEQHASHAKGHQPCGTCCRQWKVRSFL